MPAAVMTLATAAMNAMNATNVMNVMNATPVRLSGRRTDRVVPADRSQDNNIALNVKDK